CSRCRAGSSCAGTWRPRHASTRPSSPSAVCGRASPAPPVPLIRPILATNAERRYRAHTVVFTIFVVANSGGLLTPLGDPPLFLGMLRGVPFTWTFGLLPMWLFVNSLLLLSYWALDRRFHAREKPEALAMDSDNRTPLSVGGAPNLIWFAVIIFAVALIPSLDIDAVAHGHIEGVNWVPWCEIVMLSSAACSFVIGSKA